MVARTARRRATNDVGSITLEMTLVTPIILLFLFLVVFAGRVVDARGDVVAAAGDGARAASIQRNRADAEAAATQAVQDTLSSEGVSCRNGADPQVDIVPGGPGAGAGFEGGNYVEVTFACDIPLRDLLHFDLAPRAMTVDASATEIIDMHRSAE